MGSLAITYYRVFCDVCGHTEGAMSRSSGHSPCEEPDGWEWLHFDGADDDDARLLCPDCANAVRAALRERGEA